MTARAISMPTRPQIAAHGPISSPPAVIRVKRGDDRRAVRQVIEAALYAGRPVNVLASLADSAELVCRVVPRDREFQVIAHEPRASGVMPDAREVSRHAVWLLDRVLASQHREFRTAGRDR